MSGRRANPIGAGGEFGSVVSMVEKCELVKRKTVNENALKFYGV